MKGEFLFLDLSLNALMGSGARLDERHDSWGGYREYEHAYGEISFVYGATF